MDVSLRPLTPTVLSLTPSSANRFVTATVSQDTLNGWLTGGYNRSSATVRELQPFDTFTGVTREYKDVRSGLEGRDLWNGKFHATTRTSYDRNSLVKLWGPRIPSAATAQKDFQMLVVVLTTAKTLNPTTASTIDAGLERMRRQAESGTPNYNFWEATGKRGTMSFDLSKWLK